MKDTDFQSPFLGNRERLLENDIGFVIYDGFPVSEGHSLIIPHRVYSDYIDSTLNEIEGLHRLVIETKEFLNEKFKPDGFNVGINCGEAGGHTIPHVHIHLIPRYKGDVGNPRGGVRGVIPSKRNY